jgi:hypothetical protein
MKQLPSSDDLKSAYFEFAEFTFDLLTKATEDIRLLKFAAVNAQITLELFLKYVFIATGKADDITKKKRGSSAEDFVDFSQILNHAFAIKLIRGVKKKDIETLCAARNSIVHRGAASTVENDLVEVVAICYLLIHFLSSDQFGTHLLSRSYGPHPISQNTAWVSGVERFVAGLAPLNSHVPINCIHCGSKSLVSGDFITIDGSQECEDVVCLCCLTSLSTIHEIALLKCSQCCTASYFVDILNPQAGQWYVGGCSTCDNGEWVRRCTNCEEFYFKSQVKEACSENFNFCSKACKADF